MPIISEKQNILVFNLNQKKNKLKLSSFVLIDLHKTKKVFNEKQSTYILDSFKIKCK